jgi:hypothetical protein
MTIFALRISWFSGYSLHTSLIEDSTCAGNFVGCPARQAPSRPLGLPGYTEPVSLFWLTYHHFWRPR